MVKLLLWTCLRNKTFGCIYLSAEKICVSKTGYHERMDMIFHDSRPAIVTLSTRETEISGSASVTNPRQTDILVSKTVTGPREVYISV